jgi:phage gpG-like protein
MITYQQRGGEQVQKFFETFADGAKQRLYLRIQELSLKLQRHVIEDKLSGQVLKVRTGTLRRSINRRVTMSDTSIQASVGTNVKYARIHEYGFTGPEQVKAHLRKITMAFGKPLKEPRTVNVRAFTRQMNLPERSFLRSALADMTGEILDGMTAAVKGE